MKLYILFCVLLSFVIITRATNRDYYWRDYEWTIPKDAVPAGKDSNGEQTYIGQALIHGQGIFVVQIFPQAKEVFASAYGLRKTDYLVKILCSKHKENFSWMRTSSKSFQQDMLGEHPVIGGFDHVNPNKGMLHVGRLIHHVVVRIGSIEGFLENARMTYIHGTAVQWADEYEVLLYKNSKSSNSNLIVH